MKLTLTEQEHKRVDRIMGTGFTHGFRRRRCGTLVRHVPDELWRHTLACEKQQERAERAASVERANLSSALERSLEEVPA